MYLQSIWKTNYLKKEEYIFKNGLQYHHSGMTTFKNSFSELMYFTRLLRLHGKGPAVYGILCVLSASQRIKCYSEFHVLKGTPPVCYSHQLLVWETDVFLICTLTNVALFQAVLITETVQTHLTACWVLNRGAGGESGVRKIWLELQRSWSKRRLLYIY